MTSQQGALVSTSNLSRRSPLTQWPLIRDRDTKYSEEIRDISMRDGFTPSGFRRDLKSEYFRERIVRSIGLSVLEPNDRPRTGIASERSDTIYDSLPWRA